ncbi:MAG: hypothetical protein IPJ41_18325 [Phycisphaerales bacterium]|nr:hypothetical protein [Phycisphaerales bacterium]
MTRRALTPGEVICEGDLTIKRPGTGIEPWRIGEVLGRRVGRAIQADVPIIELDLQEQS